MLTLGKVTSVAVLIAAPVGCHPAVLDYFELNRREGHPLAKGRCSVIKTYGVDRSRCTADPPQVTG